MEQYIWGRCKHDLALDSSNESLNGRHSYLKSLACIRSLIVNPSTSNETISDVLVNLAQFLQRDSEPILVSHVLMLLSDVALHHRHLSYVVYDNVCTYVSICKNEPCLIAQALMVLITVADCNQTISLSSTLNEDLFLSLCSSTSASLRSWLLIYSNRFQIRPNLLVTVLLVFTKDPFPCVRRDALRALLGLSKLPDVKDCGLIREGYDRGVELLLDTYDYVRSAAIHVVCEWGQILAASDDKLEDKDPFDAVFVKICSMVRDMSMEVRLEAFLELGKIKVSENVLLHTLSKNALAKVKRPEAIGPRSHEFYVVSNVAGAFVHGLEDEYYEVRKSACSSLGALTKLSSTFALDALKLLMDMPNDDSLAVRLQSLQTMYQMITHEHLKLQQLHIHGFLVTFMDTVVYTLVDTSYLIRRTARSILQVMKMVVEKIFKSSIEGLLTNLERYPEVLWYWVELLTATSGSVGPLDFDDIGLIIILADEADIFSVLFSIGKSHGTFADNFVMGVSQEIEPSHEGKLKFDSGRVAAILVLAISASFSHRPVSNIRRKLYSYAIPNLGRICRSLYMDQDTLLPYLLTTDSLRGHELSFPMLTGGNSNEKINQVSLLQQISNETAADQLGDNPRDQKHVASDQTYQHKDISMREEANNNVKLILKTVAETWPLIRSGCIVEAQRTIRSCKGELETISMDLNASGGLLACASQYVRVVRLLAKVWEQLLPSREFHDNGTQMLYLLLEKLDVNLGRIMNSFSGFSKEEVHILELTLLTSFLRLSEVEICDHTTTLKKLREIMSRLELLCQEESIKFTDFSRELKEFLDKGDFAVLEASYIPCSYKSLLGYFSLKEVLFDGTLKHIKAELESVGNDSENPLPFISGLPVGIAFQITVYNVPGDKRMWLKMAMEDVTQYTFLDFNQMGTYGEERKVTLSVPFYRTPKAVSFSLRACIGMESPFEDVGHLADGRGGPKRELTFLCIEKKIYLASRS
ncbi:hypothetical protein GIB67_020295 [Kingdonia uniflora]|uniref:Integrator complex subunit 4/Protein SIEL C-terminal Ig-like domain-containing protein n=1 Tax=Kingdonia uniflora TaxID=39325 RepID=A0A7J7P466_9MAGN|nr:hypothetical protein GIB67_020295 [Kingdonia uniflora]